MRFFTRELYDGMQGESPHDAECFRRWELASEEYRVHLDRIRPKLPPRMQEFAGITLHDGIVRAADRPEPSQLVIAVDAASNPWGPRGVIRVHFTGVRHAEGIEHLVG